MVDTPTGGVGKGAVKNTIALNPIIGLTDEDILGTLDLLSRQAVIQPALIPKYVKSYLGDMFNILTGQSPYELDPRDNRFKDTAWQTNPVYSRLLQTWLAWKKGMNTWVDDLDLTERERVMSHLVVDLLTEALAPTNTLAGNPMALKHAFETGGQSLIKGIRNAYKDMTENHGLPSQVDRSAFKVGENLATTEGMIVHKAEMFELIQYQPRTAKVYEKPILFIPPQINKFYSSDLTPETSIVRFLAEQGFQVFSISWRNPSKEHAHWGLADYVNSVIEATDAILHITKQKTLNFYAACSGGITLVSTLQYLAAIEDSRVSAATLGVCVLEQDPEANELSKLLTQETVDMAVAQSARKGVLEGKDLTLTFSLMRPNDLIWNYVVNNYLLGNTPPPFDVLYWNGDSTNLPAKLHSDYMHQALENWFAPDSDAEFMGHTVDLSRVKNDFFIVAGLTDHITPWTSCYRTTQLVGSENIEFILTRTGHIMSLLDPPGKPKSKYFTNNENLDPDPMVWQQGTTETQGSWWPRYVEWLAERSGNEKAAPKSVGNTKHKPLYPAPGKYVFE